MYRFSLLCSLIFIAVNTHSQRKIVFDHYGVQEGFNARVCRTIAKTADGMVWITTNNGLVRYDSKRFRFFQHHPADSTTIASNFTDQMVADKQGRLWIVAEGGLDMFDPQTEKFTHCFISEEGKRVTDFSPESLYYDPVTDFIYAGTWRGLYYTRDGINELLRAKADTRSADLLKRVFLDIKPGKQDELWLCNPDGFYRYRTKSGQVEQYHIPDQDDPVGNDDGAFCLYPENENTVWVGTWTKGLVKYDPATRTGKHFYFSDYTREQNGVTYITRTGIKGEENILWVSTPGTGLAAFDTRENKFSFYYSAFENDKAGIKGATNRMLPTATEGMWIASENGLHRYDYSKQLFREIELGDLNPQFRKAFPPENISFVPTKSNTDSLCWFTIPYVGAYVYDISKRVLKDAPALLKDYLSASVYSTYVDASGVYWVATDKSGLVGIDLKTNKTIFPPHHYFINDYEWVTGFFEDALHNLWLSTYNGLFILDPERKRPHPVDAVNDLLMAKGLSLQVNGLTTDTQGRIWITTGSGNKKDNAIVVYDKNSGKANAFCEADNSFRGFPVGLEMNSITACGKEIFIATNSGLLRFDGSETDPGFELLTRYHGLSGDNIRQVICDRLGNIWCSTEFGVSCYSPVKKFFNNYRHTTSGIGPQSTPAMFVSRNTGTVYISQRGAINYFDPKEISIEAAPRVYFTGMELFNKPFLYKNRLLKHGDIIRLKHNQNMISVEFTGMSFSNPDDNRYAHRLEGLENDWSVSKNNIVSYTNLAPGKYRLLVRTSNSSGVWTDPAAVTFIISPPFWKTWWFIGLFVLAVTVLLYSLYRYRINQLVKMQRMRNTISRNLHDEIGSTLTSINILSNVSQTAMEKDPVQAKEMLEKIALQSKTIQQNMSDIVWAIRSDNDKIGDLLVRMREYASQTLEPLQINTLINVDESVLDILLGLEMRKELLLIYKEAINNITKHAGATIVEISIESRSGQLSLRIQDNGRWKGNGKSSGTGIGSMKHRATVIGGELKISGDEKGTVLLLNAPIT